MSLANTYPQVNCTTIKVDYNDQLEEYAFKDYNFINENEGKKSSGTL